jgi:hypothetical protein
VTSSSNCTKRATRGATLAQPWRNSRWASVGSHGHQREGRMCHLAGRFLPSVAHACPLFPRGTFHGKEGVVGSSPTEGFLRSPVVTGFSWCRVLLVGRRRARMETFWKLRGYPEPSGAERRNLLGPPQVTRRQPPDHGWGRSRGSALKLPLAGPDGHPPGAYEFGVFSRRSAWSVSVVTGLSRRSALVPLPQEAPRRL